MSRRRSRRAAPWILSCVGLCWIACAESADGEGSGEEPESPADPSNSESTDAPGSNAGPDAASPSDDGPAAPSSSTPNVSPSGGDEPPAPSPTPSSNGPSPAAPTSSAPAPSAPTPSGPSTAPSSTPPSIPPGSGPLGLETQCNGSDDDANGVIDDVDENQDGFCDCLSIATLGLHGSWGDGDVFSGWLRERVDGITSLGDATLTPELLDPHQVLIIRDVSAMNNPGLSYDQNEIDVLWNWVRDGGGLMTLIGYSSSAEINNVNALLSAYSLRYGSDPIIPGQGSAAPISQWFEHPLSEGIREIGADNGYPVLGQGTTFAAQDGHDLGKAVIIGDGHVLVWGDEWISYEGEWRNDSSFQVAKFWQNALRWLTRANECQVPER